MLARLSQVQGKVEGRSRQGQGKVKKRSRQGQVKVEDVEKKQKIHREAHFGTTHYVINMDLICDGYEFDMYLIQFQ